MLSDFKQFCYILWDWITDSLLGMLVTPDPWITWSFKHIFGPWIVIFQVEVGISMICSDKACFPRRLMSWISHSCLIHRANVNLIKVIKQRLRFGGWRPDQLNNQIISFYCHKNQEKTKNLGGKIMMKKVVDPNSEWFFDNYFIMPQVFFDALGFAHILKGYVTQPFF